MTPLGAAAFIMGLVLAPVVLQLLLLWGDHRAAVRAADDAVAAHYQGEGMDP